MSAPPKTPVTTPQSDHNSARTTHPYSHDSYFEDLQDLYPLSPDVAQVASPDLKADIQDTYHDEVELALGLASGKSANDTAGATDSTDPIAKTAPAAAPATTTTTAATAATAATAETAVAAIPNSTADSHNNEHYEFHYHNSELEHLFADTIVHSGSGHDKDLALKAKLLATLGWRLASCGAETRLIVQSVKKMAHDLGCNSIDMSITRDGILVKLRKGHLVSVEFKEVKHFAINMDSLARLHEICLKVSEGKLRDLQKIFLAIRAVRPRHYNHKHIIFIEAAAGAGFAYLNGGNLAVCISALVGGIVLMFARFAFIKRGFFESFTFMLSAFLGSLTACAVAHFGFDTSTTETILAATATTLLLVPGFPLINGFLDIFKGYVPIGLTRLVIASVLVISAAIGLLTTSYVTHFLAWLF